MLTVSVLSGNFFQTLPVWLFLDTSSTQPCQKKLSLSILPTKYHTENKVRNMSTWNQIRVCSPRRWNFWTDWRIETHHLPLSETVLITKRLIKALSGYFYGLHLSWWSYDGNTCTDIDHPAIIPYFWCNIQMTLQHARRYQSNLKTVNSDQSWAFQVEGNQVICAIYSWRRAGDEKALL